MSEKWIIGAVLLFFAIMMSSSLYSNHQRLECRTEMAKSNKSADDIMKICR